MYLEHFGLNEPPFRITPHTEFFFSGANRGSTLDALLYAIVHDQGIVKVTGEVGSGKTMLCRMLTERLPARVIPLYLANPALSRDDIAFAIAEELGLGFEGNMRTSAIVRNLQERLIALHADGRQVVVLIDEAHAMPAETLEQIRLLSNLETSRHKLLHIVLFGQPELDQMLAKPDMRQLRERITHHFTLAPLTREDVASYIDFRMRTAGYRGPEVFSARAVGMISRASHGLTRRINILADKALLAAFAEGSHRVTPREARIAIRDALYDTTGGKKYAPLFTAAGFAIAGLVVTSLLLILPWRQKDGIPASELASRTVPAGEAAPQQERHMREGPASPPSAAHDNRADTKALPPSAASGTSESPASPSNPEFSPVITARLNETRQWITQTSPDRWFIQLATATVADVPFVTQYLAQADRLLDPGRAGLYLADLGSEKRLGIIYGDFESQEAAQRGISALPPELRAAKPFPRQVIRLK